MGLCFVNFVVWLLIVPVASEGKVTGRATCESIGPGEPARVTCHYSENVVKADVVRAVSLLRDTGGKEEKVVVCHRFLNNGFDCIPTAGYKVNGTISDQMTINIPRAQPEHQGKYYCELVIQQTEFQMESCDLEYKARDLSTTSTPPSEQKRDDHLNRDTGSSHAILWVIAVFVFILVLLAIAVLFVLWRLRRRRYRRQHYTTGETLHRMAFNTDTDNAPRKMNFEQFPYNRTEGKDLLPGVSNGENVGMAAKPPYSSGDASTRRVTYHGSNTLLSTDTHPQSRLRLILAWARRRFFNGDRRCNSDSDNLDSAGRKETSGRSRSKSAGTYLFGNREAKLSAK